MALLLLSCFPFYHQSTARNVLCSNCTALPCDGAAPCAALGVIILIPRTEVLCDYARRMLQNEDLNAFIILIISSSHHLSSEGFQNLLSKPHSLLQQVCITYAKVHRK